MCQGNSLRRTQFPPKASSLLNAQQMGGNIDSFSQLQTRFNMFSKILWLTDII